MVWTVWTVGGLVAATLCIVGGVLLLWGRRNDPDDPHRLSEPARLVIGLSLVLVGYHAASYSLPQGWLALRVPPDRLWLLGAGVVVAIGLTLLSDRLDAKAMESEGDGGDGSGEA